MHCLGSFPNWDSIAVYKGLPSNVQKSGCRLSAQFGNVYATAAIYCFYLFTFNDYILKWSQIIFYKKKLFQFSSVVQSCLTLCSPMVCSTLGFPVHHQLPEPAQTHVRWVVDATQQFHPLSSPSPPAFNLAQHQGLFQRVSSSHQVAKVLGFQLQHQSFQWIFRTDFF